MKRYISVFISILLTTALMAQLPQGRTSATIIADALAQLPADTPDQYEKIMTDLVSTGETGLTDLVGRLNPPGNVSNEAVDFAIDGWVNFVANDDAKRAVAANTLEKALTQPLHDEIKASLIRQLEKIASDENVDGLSAFLTDKRLSGLASRVLVSIGSEKSKQSLLTALSAQSSNERIENLVNAIGQAGYAEAENELLALLAQDKSAGLNKTILSALSEAGSVNSLPAMKAAAQASGFLYTGKDDNTGYYLSFLNRLGRSNPEIVQKEAAALLKSAGKTGNDNLKVAASQILMNVPTAKPLNVLKGALKDGDMQYLTGVLDAGVFESDRKATALIAGQLTPKASPRKQAVLLYWLGNKKIPGITGAIAPYARSSDKMVQKAAVSSLADIGNEPAMLALAGLLKSNDNATVELAKNALSSYDGDLSYTLASVFDQSGDAGKTAVLELIADRKMDGQYNLVYNQLFTDNEAVKSAAAETLKHVSSESNLSDLFTLLEQTDTKHVPSIQQAINSVMNTMPVDKQLELIGEKMKSSSNKKLYYSLLANSKSKQAMDAIISAYENETGDNKAAAFEALTGWGKFEVVYPLLDIARGSSNKRELEKLTDALVSTVTRSNETGAVRYLYLREAMQFAQNDAQRNAILRHIGNTGLYQAMLYVAPFMDNPALSENAALAAMNIGTGGSDFAGAETTKILNKVSKTLKNPDADYQRQSIAKYLNENPQEGGYVSLFNGKNLDGWKGLVENPIKRAQMTPKQLAAAQKEADRRAGESWIIEDGELLFTGKGDNLCTQKQYGDFEMLVDWKMYEGPEPDAGIYLRGTPQVQIWDTSRVDVGAQVGSGGLYNNQKHVSKPLKVADLRVGDWNTFYIKMVGERVTVILNGELVTDNVVLENFWDRKRPIFPMEQIELQAHGSKVAYRDIHIKEIPRPEPYELTAEEKKEGYEVLFDGTNLDRWTGNKDDYVVESGNIVLYPSQSFGGNLYTKEEFGNFVIRFEFMLTPGANNGLGIRTPLEGDAAYAGMELQILDDDAPIYKDLEEYQYHGSVYGVIPAKRGHLKPVGEWNYQEVIADGDNIRITLNGNVILDGNLREASKNGTIDGKNHPGLLNKSGHIGFLGHGSKVKFKNVRIRELK